MWKKSEVREKLDRVSSSAFDPVAQVPWEHEIVWDPEELLCPCDRQLEGEELVQCGNCRRRFHHRCLDLDNLPESSVVRLVPSLQRFVAFIASSHPPFNRHPICTDPPPFRPGSARSVSGMCPRCGPG